MRAQALEDAGPAMNSQAIAIPQIDPVPRVSIQAFCETSEIATVVQGAINDRRMSKAHVKTKYGRRRRGGGGLSKRTDAERDNSRGDRQRHHSLSPTDRARGPSMTT